MPDLHRDRLSSEIRRAIAESRKCCAGYRAAKERMDDAIRCARERLGQAYRVEQANADLGRMRLARAAEISRAPAPVRPQPQATVS